MKDLPIEVLYNIFNEFSPEELYEIQFTCRSWYTSAHILFLKKIVISSQKIEKFIGSLDANPNPAYFNATKVMSMDTSDYKKGSYKKYTLTAENVKKLFNFPNLEVVNLSGEASFAENLTKRFALRSFKLARN